MLVRALMTMKIGVSSVTDLKPRRPGSFGRRDEVVDGGDEVGRSEEPYAASCASESTDSTTPTWESTGHCRAANSAIVH